MLDTHYAKDFINHAFKDFGEEELVYDAASSDKSVTLPRISPDGRYLLFALGQYGCFHSRHRDADIVCIPMDQYTGTGLTADTASPVDLTLLNSEGYSDSYPSWSSNGHWIMCASRRDDDNYSRVYFAYFNNGNVAKAFLLPQEDPELHISLLRKTGIVARRSAFSIPDRPMSATRMPTTAPVRIPTGPVPITAIPPPPHTAAPIAAKTTPISPESQSIPIASVRDSFTPERPVLSGIVPSDICSGGTPQRTHSAVSSFSSVRMRPESHA